MNELIKPFAGMLVFLLFILILVIGFKAIDEIEEKGLKGILTELWEGTGERKGDE